MAGFGAKGAPGAAGAKGALGAAGVGDAMDTAVGLPPGGGGAPNGPGDEEVEMVGRLPGMGGEGRGCRGSWAHRELMAPRAHPQVCQYHWTEPEVPWGCQPLVGLVGQEFLELQEAGSTASPEDGKMG